MRLATDWQHHFSIVDFDVLRSMIIELVRHHERQLTGDEPSLDWESSSSRTCIVKYGNSGSLYHIINQDPDAIAAEYQLRFDSVPVFSWHEYRWPHLHDKHQRRPHQSIHLPDSCLQELMQYHIDADTSWLQRYRASLRLDRTAKVNEISVVTEADSIEVLQSGSHGSGW